MRTLIVLFLIMLLSCESKENIKLEIWEKIRTEVKVNNIDYLLEISDDSLQCMECNNGKDIIKKDAFFRKHFNQMRIASNSEYTFYTENINSNEFNKRHRINYSLEGKTNVIYTLLEGDKRIKFLGVFSAP